jgi:serine/threonine protein kinase
MPPETIQDAARSDPRSDIYAVGALGYYLLTAKNVFDARSVSELYEKHLKESPIPPRQRTTNPVSAELEEVLLRCLEKEPALRVQSVGELRALLLSGPHSSEWGLRQRAAWWTRYHEQENQGKGQSAQREPRLIDPTIKIDFASR